MDLTEIEEKLNTLGEMGELTPVEAMSRANEIVKAINKVVEEQVEEEDYETLAKLYEKAASAYLLAAEKVSRESRDRVAFPASYWSMRARQVRLMLRKPSALRSKAPRISKEGYRDVQKTLDDLFNKIKRLIKPSPTEKSRLRGPVGELCSTSEESLSKEIGVDRSVIRSFFDTIKQNTDLEQKLGKENYEIVIGRENDVGLVGAIYLALKGAIENLKAGNEIKGKILDIIEKYSERNSVNNFIRCKEALNVLENTLKILVEEKNPFEFGVSIVQKRLRIPHYESTIFAFEMVRYMLDQNEIKPSIGKSMAKEILYDGLELLITELKLRNIILDALEDIAESFVQGKIDRENASDQIRHVLELYVNTLDVTRSRFS